MGEKRPAVWALAAGNLAVGATALAPVALLPFLVAGLPVPLGTAALLVSVGAAVMAVASPAMAELTARVDRRRLLLAMLALAAAGNVASALAPGFWPLLAVRVLVVVCAAVFTPQAASAVSLLVPGAGRAGAVAAVFLGWSFAMAFGLPVLGLLGEWGGWRMGYWALAALSVAAWAAVRLTVPAGLRIAPLGRAAWARAAADPAIRRTLAVTSVSLGGQFMLFPFVAVLLRDRAGMGADAVAVAFFVYGVAGLLGNVAATRAVGRLGLRRAIAATLGVSIVGMAAASGFGWGLAAAMAAMVAWGLGGAATNSLQQARLIALGPELAPVTVALNTSVLYVGQAAGAAVGAALLLGAPALLPVAAAGVAAVAWALSWRIGDVEARA